MSSPTLPLSNIVDATVLIQPNAVAPPAFNQALIVGNSSTIPTYGVGGRVVLFSGGSTILSQMLAYGFSSTSEEYLGAQNFLAASSNPFFLAIGRQDATAISSFTIDAAGTGYAIGDLVYPTGISNAILKVTAEASGIPSALAFVQQGTGATVTTGVATTTNGSGTGLTLNITAIGETALQAIQACRIVSPSWYLFNVLGSSDGDNIAMTEWAQTAAPVCQNFFRTFSSNVTTGAAGNIFSTLKAGDYNRYQGVYSTVQTAATTNCATTNGSPNITLTSATGVVAGQGAFGTGIPLGTTLLSIVGTAGVLSQNATATSSSVSLNFNAAPNNAYIACGLMGLAMGLNTGFNNSYFTLTNKNLVGMVAEPITQLEYNTIAANNGNVYGNFGGSFNSYATGITGSGQYFDNILGIDMLVADIQYAGANCVAAYNAVGQNDSGQSVILHAMNQNGCQPSANRGFLSPGVWEGSTIAFGNPPNTTIALQAGTAMPNGFLNVSPSYAQLGAKPAKRASAPVYCAVNQTDAVQQIIIAVLVQQ
jgi:hypothetical protein